MTGLGLRVAVVGGWWLWTGVRAGEWARHNHRRPVATPTRPFACRAHLLSTRPYHPTPRHLLSLQEYNEEEEQKEEEEGPMDGYRMLVSVGSEGKPSVMQVSIAPVFLARLLAVNQEPRFSNLAHPYRRSAAS